MFTITRTAGSTPATLDCLATLLGIAAVWSLSGLLIAGHATLSPVLYVVLLGVAITAHLLHHAACLANPPRVRSIRGFLWAPFGRVRRIPQDMPLLAAKAYHFNPSIAYSPMLVWVGWWSCRTFTGDPASDEYFFFYRRNRYAVLATNLIPSR